MKKIIFTILCNDFTGSVISFLFSDKIPNVRCAWNVKFFTRSKHIGNKIRAMIFFGFYEAAETRLIKKYMPNNLPVIELGASIGILSNLILSKINSDKMLYSVEANTLLLDLIDLNTSDYTNKKIINKALTYKESEYILFNVSSNNTEGSVVDSFSKGSSVLRVPVVKLSDLVSGEFILVSDIEGSEIEFIMNDHDSMNECSHLFIELHKTRYNNSVYTVEDMNNLIHNKYGFELVERDGNVFYFRK